MEYQINSSYCALELAAKSDSSFEAPKAGHLHAKSLFDTVYGDKIKTGQWIKQQTNDWNSQKLQHVFQSLTNPTGLTWDWTVELTPKSSSVQARRIGSSVAWGMDSQTQRASIMMERRDGWDSEGNFVLCAEIDAKFPDNLVFKRKELIKDEIERSSTVKIGFGKSCTDDRKITFTVSGVNSPQCGPLYHSVFSCSFNL